MTKKKQETVLCQICKEQKKISEVLSAEIIREPIVDRTNSVFYILFLVSAKRTGYLFTAASFINSFISRIALSIPTSTAREMILCPM